MKCHFPRHILPVMILVSLLMGLIPVSSASASEFGYANANVVLRESSSKNSEALLTIPKGEKVSVIRSSGDWYRVRYGHSTGYVMKQYMDLSETSLIVNQSKIDDLGDPPGPLYIGDEGTDVKLLQKALTILGYYDLKADGIYGNGTTAAVAMFQQANKLEADGIAGKLTIRAIFGGCASKADITVSGRDASETSNSGSSSSDSADKQKNVVGSFSEIGSAPTASEEGDSGTNVIKLQQALNLLGYYTGVIDGDYGAKTKAAVMRFQKNRGMSADGIAGSSTIRVLFAGTSKKTTASSSSSSSSSKKYETLVLDWFADNVSSVIPKGAKFVVKDVRTGKTFNAVRWSGTNHLDAEPATSDDTAKYKTIYRGAWSWDRRPILILYKNKVYAASMNGMPHGTSTISNNFDGHFCIHFKNSKTHETDVVDSDHQEAVTVANKATW